jgi:hypothetical protein
MCPAGVRKSKAGLRRHADADPSRRRALPRKMRFEYAERGEQHPRRGVTVDAGVLYGPFPYAFAEPDDVPQTGRREAARAAEPR